MRGVCRRDDTLANISPTTVFVPDRRRGFGAASLSLGVDGVDGVDGVGIGHDDVRRLRCSASGLIRLLNQTAEFRFVSESGSEHEHPAAKGELRVRVVPSRCGTIRCFWKPHIPNNHSIAAGAFQ